MKTKFYVLATLLLASMVNVTAEETCDRVYGADNWSTTQPITYDKNNTLFINKDNFSSAEVGNAIKIYGFDGEGDHTKIYLYGWDQILPGSDYRNPSNVEEYQVLFYLTEDMITKISTDGCRIFGEGMTVNRVELCDGKAGALKFGKTIWTGYFWMDNSWSLEIFKEAFASVDFSKYGKMRIYYEANSTDFKMRLFTKFGSATGEEEDGDDLKIAGSYPDVHADGEARTINGVKVPMELITLHNNYVDIPLTEAIKTNLRTINETYGRSLFIKCNLNEVDPFNVTDIVLLPIKPDDCPNCFYVY